MSKTGRQRKLQLLKALVAGQSKADKLKQETKINILQTKMMEKELSAMKEHLESLEKQRGALIKIRTDLGLGEQELEELAKQDSVPQEQTESKPDTEQNTEPDTEPNSESVKDSD